MHNLAFFRWIPCRISRKISELVQDRTKSQSSTWKMCVPIHVDLQGWVSGSDFWVGFQFKIKTHIFWPEPVCKSEKNAHFWFWSFLCSSASSLGFAFPTSLPEFFIFGFFPPSSPVLHLKLRPQVPYSSSPVTFFILLGLTWSGSSSRPFFVFCSPVLAFRSSLALFFHFVFRSPLF